MNAPNDNDETGYGQSIRRAINLHNLAWFVGGLVFALVLVNVWEYVR